MNKQLLPINKAKPKSLQTKSKKIFESLDISQNSILDYQRKIGLFLDFINQQGFNHSTFLEFKRQLAQRGELAVNTKNKYLTTARVFLKELNRRGLIPVDITQNIKSFKQNRRHKVSGINADELHILFGQIKKLPATPINLRTKVILALLIFQGLRQAEIVGLDIKDIDFINQTALIKSKGKDDKELIHLHPKTLKILKAYIKTIQLHTGPLFTSHSNNHQGSRLSTRSLRMIIKDVLAKAGIERTTHGFRHFFVSQLIENYDGDLLSISKYTRHKNIEMLQVYNDNLKQQQDLPKYYQAFSGVSF